MSGRVATCLALSHMLILYANAICILITIQGPCYAAIANNGVIYSGGKDGKLRAWEEASLRPLWTIEIPRHGPYAIRLINVDVF